MTLYCQAAMDFVMEEDLKAHLTCWYIQKYVKENPHPQCFIHSSQWPCYCCGRGRKRVSQGINSVLQHVLSLQLNLQLRTFQRLINVTLGYSRDERSCTIAMCEQRSHGRRQRADRLSMASNQQDMDLTGAEACYHNRKPPRRSIWIAESVNMKQMWVKRHVAVLPFLLGAHWTQSCATANQLCFSRLGWKLWWFQWCSGFDDFYILFLFIFTSEKFFFFQSYKVNLVDFK